MINAIKFLETWRGYNIYKANGYYLVAKAGHVCEADAYVYLHDAYCAIISLTHNDPVG